MVKIMMRDRAEITSELKDEVRPAETAADKAVDLLEGLLMVLKHPELDDCGNHRALTLNDPAHPEDNDIHEELLKLIGDDSFEPPSAAQDHHSRQVVYNSASGKIIRQAYNVDSGNGETAAALTYVTYSTEVCLDSGLVIPELGDITVRNSA